MSKIDLEALVIRLFEVGAVKVGDIEAKVGRRAPFYFDLRVVVSYPDIMITLADCLQDIAQEMAHDLICGVPYAALPLATILSIETKIPMIIKRKENASRRCIDGVFAANQRCLVVEDVVTSGGSLWEAVSALRDEGLRVVHAVVVLDCEQGGATILANHGVHIRSVFTLTTFVKILNRAGKINVETMEIILEHIKLCQFVWKDNY